MIRGDIQNLILKIKITIYNLIKIIYQRIIIEQKDIIRMNIVMILLSQEIKLTLIIQII